MGLKYYAQENRPLTNYLIRSIHSELTENQPLCKGIDSLGRVVKTALLHGCYKKWPNNPSRLDGLIHEYCPPEQVQPQMDQLLAWHGEHLSAKVSPEVEAAFLHHRFIQIHPFQDGNGRVARALATLIFLRCGLFPLVVTSEQWPEYILALEEADKGDLRPLIDLFSAIAIETLREALKIKISWLK
jgi:Fic family protein